MFESPAVTLKYTIPVLFFGTIKLSSCHDVGTFCGTVGLSFRVDLRSNRLCGIIVLRSTVITLYKLTISVLLIYFLILNAELTVISAALKSKMH